MKPEIFYWLIQTPEVTATFIGGPLRASKSGYVFLTKPDGTPLLEVAAGYVTPSNEEEAASRFVADRRAAKQGNN